LVPFVVFDGRLRALSKIRQLSSLKLPIGSIGSDTLLSVHPLIDISGACVLVGHLVPVDFQVLLCNDLVALTLFGCAITCNRQIMSIHGIFLQLSFFYDRSLR
jgi:hypothetical protein